MENRSSEHHLSDEEVITALYAGAEGDAHLQRCAECRVRLDATAAQRAHLEQQYHPEEDLSFEFLSAQRRQIRAQMDQQPRLEWLRGVRRWATATALVTVAAGTLVIRTQHQTPPPPDNISDDQLAAEVSRFAADSEPQPAEPLHALFQPEP